MVTAVCRCKKSQAQGIVPINSSAARQEMAFTQVPHLQRTCRYDNESIMGGHRLQIDGRSSSHVNMEQALWLACARTTCQPSVAAEGLRYSCSRAGTVRE